METATLKPSPGHLPSEIPSHRNPPLAPSQELAYRNKCIQLKRRLNEIEANNDSTRKRISSEKERVQKMRLLRAILLNQLQEIMTTNGKSLTTDQLNKLGITETTELEPPAAGGPEGETLLDDSSDESEDEEIPEPSERPTRMRRTNNNYRETVMNNTPSTSTSKPLAAAASYAQTGLPNLAPANSTYSPATAREALPTSSFQVTSTPLAAGSPAYSQSSHHNAGYSERYGHSSPITQHRTHYDHRSHENGTAPSMQLVRPVPPDAPLVQFKTHMRPQLEADSYPADQIEARIDEEWRKLSDENRGLWEQRYQEQLVEYQQDYEVYEHHVRRAEFR